MKKHIALFAVLAALVGSATAFAAGPCGGCKDCKPQSTVQGSGLTDAEMKP